MSAPVACKWRSECVLSLSLFRVFSALEFWWMSVIDVAAKVRVSVWMIAGKRDGSKRPFSSALGSIGAKWVRDDVKHRICYIIISPLRSIDGCCSAGPICSWIKRLGQHGNRPLFGRRRVFWRGRLPGELNESWGANLAKIMISLPSPSKDVE